MVLTVYRIRIVKKKDNKRDYNADRHISSNISLSRKEYEAPVPLVMSGARASF